MDTSLGEVATEVIPRLSYDASLMREYLGRYNLTEQIVRHFGAGLYLEPGVLSGKLVFPIHDRHGGLIGYAAWDEDRDSYIYPRDFVRSGHLFNLNRAASARGVHSTRLIVVEDVLSCVAVYGAGYPNTVALMGSEMSEQQEHALVGSFDQILFMLDGDDEGWAASQVLVGNLATEFFVKAAVLPPNQKPMTLSEEVIRATIQAM